MTVPILHDDLVEGDETFFLELRDPVGLATLAVPTGTATIVDDDEEGLGTFEVIDARSGHRRIGPEPFDPSAPNRVRP